MKDDGSKQALELVSKTEQGRRVIWDLLSFCGVYSDLAGESNDVFKQLGKREVGLHLLGLLADIDDEIIFDMMRESKIRATIEEIENERSNNGSTASSNSADDTRNSSPIDDLLHSGDDDSGHNYLSEYDGSGIAAII